MFAVDRATDIIFEMNFVIRTQEISQTFTLPFLLGGRFTLNLIKFNLHKVINRISQNYLQNYTMLKGQMQPKAPYPQHTFNNQVTHSRRQQLKVYRNIKLQIS